MNWSRCPLCGCDDYWKWGVETIEVVEATNQLTLYPAEDGTLQKAEWGFSEPDWNSSQTVGYRTQCCEGDLPGEYVAELTTILRP